MITYQYQVQSLSRDMRKWEYLFHRKTLMGARNGLKTFKKWHKHIRIVKAISFSIIKVIDE